MKRLSYPLPKEQAYDLFERTRERSVGGPVDERTVDDIVNGKDQLANDLFRCDGSLWATNRYEDEQSLGFRRSGYGPPQPPNEPPIPNN